MSDWSMFEIEDSAWNVFDDNYDRIVPGEGADQINSEIQGDLLKKARHDIESSIEKTAADDVSAGKNIPQKNEEPVLQSSLTVKNSQIPKFSLPDVPENVNTLPHASKLLNGPTVLASIGARTSNTDLNSHNNNEGLFSDDLMFGCIDGSDRSNMCNFSLNIDPTDTQLEILEKGSKEKENSDNLLDYEWPDIGNLEDVNEFFSGSIFGQRGSGKADQQSWFPFSSSSYVINGSEENLKSGSQPSCPELSAMGTSLDANMNAWPENCPPTMNIENSSSIDYGSFAQWLDAEVKGDLDSEGQVNLFNGATDANTSTFRTSGNGNSVGSVQGSNMVSMQLENSATQKQLKENGGCKTFKDTSRLSYHIPVPLGNCNDQRCTSFAAAPETYFSSQMHASEYYSSSYPQTQNPCGKINGTHYPHTISHIQSPSCLSPKETNSSSSTNIPAQVSDNGYCSKKMLDPMSNSPTSSSQKMLEDRNLGQHLNSKLSICHHSDIYTFPLITSQDPSTKNLHKLENEVGVHSKLKEATSDRLRIEIDPSLQENSCTSSLGNIMSSPKTLQQLKNVMDQLDIRTKLCIRDGLYRLARSAEQRQSIGSPQPGCGVCTDKSKRCYGVLGAELETDTNPIDRSITHLLFYKTSDCSRSLGADPMPNK